MINNGLRSRPRWTAVVGSVVVVDWATKWWAHHILSACHKSVSHCASVQVSDHVRLMLEHNAGSALGFSQDMMVWTLLSAVGLLLAAFLTRRAWVPRARMLDMSLLVGGAFANAGERIFFGSVIDFIALGPIEPTGYLVMNVADIALVFGAAAATFNLARARRYRSTEIKPSICGE
jgi:lipoprotein signal peptidase